ncbi:MAG: segregation/condensation protein A [Phycisphaerae bacterium]|nr:segregation/condensation protein A [Phycisphaerae bacterium]
MSAGDEYRVSLDVFSGPMDLLLHLIRRDELDVQDVALAQVADQYLQYVRMMHALDPNAAGEFLVLAATLAEIKSRALLPTPPLEAMDDPISEARSVLVKQLLEYKRFKDAARSLGRAADDRARRFVRRPGRLPPELDGVELEEANVWDLLKAFNRVMTAIGEGPSHHDVRYEDTPIEVVAEEILAVIESEGPTRFSALFGDAARPRVIVIQRFLAILELMKQRKIRCEQSRLFDDIFLVRLDEVFEEAEAAASDAALDAPAPVAAGEAATAEIVAQAEFAAAADEDAIDQDDENSATVDDAVERRSRNGR